MQFEDFTHEDLQKIISRLDQAIYNHLQWFNSLIRTLICRLPPDQHDMNEEAYKECRFGQWYYSESVEGLKAHPGFRALGEEHVRLHQMTKNLLKTINEGTTVSPPDYDNFSNALERMRLEISTLKREMQDLLYTRDTLTGAINRVNMLTSLREQQEMSKREHQPHCIAMMDLDYFKKVNDQHGHAVGDSVLAAVSHFIIEHLSPNDKIFRYGGEEFLIFLSNITPQAAFERIDGLRKKLSETDLPTTPSLRITASFGIAPLDIYSPVEQSIQHSDEAALAAKAKGRNNVQVWNPDIGVSKSA